MMSFTKKIAYNTAIQILGKVLGTIFGLITVALMARYLGREGFGYYSTVITYLSFFGIIIEFGFHITTLQLVAEERFNKEKLIGNVMALRLVSALIAFGLAQILIWFFPYPLEIKLGVTCATLSFICITLNQILIAVLQITLHMDKAALGEVLGRAVLFGLIALCVYYNLGFLPMMLSIGFGSLVNLFYNYLKARGYVKISFLYDKIIWRELLIRSWPIGLSIFFNLIYLKADMLILSFTATQSDVGIYGATYRFLDVLTTIPAMFMGLIVTSLRTYWLKKDIIAFDRIFQKAFDFLVVLVVPMIFGTYLLADKIILLIAGAEFLESARVLRLIVWALGAIFIGGGLYGYTIIALNKQRSMMKGYGLTAIIALALYLIFIPRYGYFGAAAVTVFAEYLISCLIIIEVFRSVKKAPRLGIVWRSFLATFGMSISIIFAGQLNLFVVIILAVFVYAILIYGLGGTPRETMRILFSSRKI